MRKRFSRSYRHWSPRFKWSARDEMLLIEWEKESKGTPRKMKRRKPDFYPKG